MLSVIIPSRTEIFLNKTIEDVLKNATGDIEVLPVLDGWEPDELINDPRVRYIRLPQVSYTQKRHGINKAVAESKGEYVMSLDAHCMMAKGFDTQLTKDHQHNWVQIPRRHRLDAKNWCLQQQVDDRPPIDYEYPMFLPLLNDKGLHGFKWDARTLDRWNIPIDETMAIQASTWFMTKDWFNTRGFMNLKYMGFGQEGEEICFETWKNGGKVMTNKNTWYAHLHKGKTYGRMYHLSNAELLKSYAYSYNHWVIENKDFFISMIDKFSPLPKWPKDWKEQLWKH
jgi:hypothetical protein